MPISHLFLALLVVVVWGANFMFVSISLQEISPLMLCALRFFLASVPAVFFIKRPTAPFNLVAWYGLVMFALQFTFIFVGMKIGMSAGMASLLMQVQVFFSMFFAVFFLGEAPPNAGQLFGALISFSGIGVVAFHFDADVSLPGFILMLMAAATWGVGNLIAKKIKGDSRNMLGLIAWGNLVACVPMFFLSYFIEGAANFVGTWGHLSWKGMASLMYIVFASTWIGYGIWNWLVARYPVGMIVPFTLLVPVVAILASVLFLGEPFQLWKLASGLLVISGLCINILGSRLMGNRRAAV